MSIGSAGRGKGEGNPSGLHSEHEARSGTPSYHQDQDPS